MICLYRNTGLSYVPHKEMSLPSEEYDSFFFHSFGVFELLILPFDKELSVLSSVF